jgi:apolipoprotein N-acyltransferase
MRLDRDQWGNLGLALLGGVALHDGFGLHPVWWLAWVAPVPVLVAVLRAGPHEASILAGLAGLIASSAYVGYFRLVMPLPAAAGVTALVALLWMFMIARTRLAMLRLQSAWSVLAYPLMWCAADTVLAWLHPDGNWISIAYSQAGVLPAVQILSLFGMAGLVFVMSLLPATMALAAWRGWRVARTPLLCAVTLTAATFAFGYVRLQAPPESGGQLVGMVAIDDAIGPRASAVYAQRIWSQYERHAATLAGQGARLIVLPEKIALLDSAASEQARNRMAALAARLRTWIAVGIGTDDGKHKRNRYLLFAPDGRLVADYLKHHLAPPERDFVPGIAFDTRVVDGVSYGLAVCKDMHFAGMGRAYGAQHVQAMLVPAWDFGEDGEYAARQSALRGVESGFAMVRSAREGLLTVTDPYGRIVAETPSAGMPGAVLLARVPAQAAIHTLHRDIGDLFGWMCTAGAALLIVLTLRAKPIRFSRLLETQLR